VGAEPKSFYGTLESTRGLAAIMVALHHVGQAPVAGGTVRLVDRALSDEASAIWRALGYGYKLLGNGFGAVIFFFVLSGFVLAGSLSRAKAPVGVGALQFALGRLFRIYPAAFTAILIFWLIHFVFGRGLVGPEFYGFGSLVQHMLLFDIRVNGVMWSLQAELLAAPLIFISFLLISRFERFGICGVMLIAGLLVASSFVISWRIFLRQSMGPTAWLTVWYAFVFGVLTFRLGGNIWGRRDTCGQRIVQPAAMLLALIMIFGVVSISEWITLGWKGRLLKEVGWRPLLESIGSAMVVGLLAFGALPRIRRLLSLPLFRFYGRISYSFYVLHPLTLTVIWFMPNELARVLDAGVPGAVLLWGLAFASILAVTPLAWLSYRYVEVPGIALGRRLQVSVASAPPQPSPAAGLAAAAKPASPPDFRQSV
jgi:peptidoglycan/LPS O-acetylase OafA/YrhL